MPRQTCRPLKAELESAGRKWSLASSCASAFGATLRELRRILATHRRRAFALVTRADVRLAFGLLLISIAARFLALALGEILLVVGIALVLRGSGFVQRDGDRLLAGLNLPAFAMRAAFQFAMLVFVHDAANRLSLARG